MSKLMILIKFRNLLNYTNRNMIKITNTYLEKSNKFKKL